MSKDSTPRRTSSKSVKKSSQKPAKPRPDFPLFSHQTGYWCKKVHGKPVLFTRWRDDPKGEAALAMWLEQKDDLLSGRQPRAKDPNGLTIADLCDEFLTHKADRRDNGELAVRSFRAYHDTCSKLVKVFGKGRVVIDLQTDDFGKLRKELAKARGAVALASVVETVRTWLLPEETLSTSS